MNRAKEFSARRPIVGRTASVLSCCLAAAVVWSVALPTAHADDAAAPAPASAAPSAPTATTEPAPLASTSAFPVVSDTSAASRRDHETEQEIGGDHSGDVSAAFVPKNRASVQNFAVEFRFGPYWPNIDSEANLNGKTPYKDTFGGGARGFAQLEFDWQALHIKKCGSLGLGAAVGYTSMSAYASLAGTKTASAEQTSLTIVPGYVVAVVRLDVLAREFSIPLVPYAKAGLGYAYWATSTPNGLSTGNGKTGRGLSSGTHLAIGLAFELDFLDRHSAKNLDEATGINHTLVFAEYFRSGLTGLGQSNTLQVGTDSFAFGLGFEF